MSKTKETAGTEYPVLEIDGHALTIIDRPASPSDIPPGLFAYDAFPGQDAATLELHLHWQGPLTVPAVVCADELPLDARGAYRVCDWDRIAPEPFGPWLRNLVDRYNARADAYNWALVHPDDDSGRGSAEKPHYIRQVVIPLFKNLARILPTHPPMRVPRADKCELNWGLYKIFIGDILVGGIAPSFDPNIPLYFAVACRNTGAGPQQPVETLEQLAALVARQYAVYLSEPHPRRQKGSK